MRKLIQTLSALTIVLSTTFQVSEARDKRWSDGASQRRADYIFMEAQRQQALDNNDAYYDLLKRAYELNPAETSVGHDLGFYTVVLNQSNPDKIEEGLALMKNHFDARPDDYYASVLYGTISEKLGDNRRAAGVWEKLHEIYPDKTEVSLRLADAYLSRTADSLAQNKAIDLLNTVQVAEGPSLQLTARKVMSYMSRRDTVSALGEVGNLIKETPRSPESRVYAGDVFMSLGDRDSALYYYNDACAVDPSSGLAVYKRAEYFKEIGDTLAYDTEVYKALELPDMELDTKLEILTGYVREQYTDSLKQPRINELFGKLVDLYPHDASVHDLYWSYFVAIKDYKSAAEQLEYVLDTDLANEERWHALVSLYFSADDYGKAYDTAVKAANMFKENPMFALLAGEAASINNQSDSALVWLDRCLEVPDLTDEFRSKVVATKGDVKYKLGEADEAFELYDEAIKLDPTNAMAMNNCAYFMAESGMDLDRAAEFSRQSLNIAPDNESSLDTYAWIMFKKSDYKEAKSFIDKALELTESPSAELYQHAGDIYFMNGDPDKALEYWEMAAELDPDDALLQKKIKHKTYFFK
ncbi:MAG: tetratricopeptide repeat protein [Muribaculaceae bacterium]|nr:tetratricopeptide repeat protein [Muribaculaceae bacterium]